MLLQSIMPYCLASIMFSMGLGLRLNDFQRITRQPRIVGSLLVGQLLGLPLLAILIITLLDLPSMQAIALLLIALCPGGVTSNLFCQLSRGDTALSVSLTALSSLIGSFSLPFLLLLGFSYYGLTQGAIELSFVVTIKQLLLVTILPMVIGMMLSAYQPWLRVRGQQLASRASGLFFAIVVLILWQQQWSSIQNNAATIGTAVVLLNLGAISLALMINKFIKINGKQAISSCYEIGLQNGALAFYVAFNLLDEPLLATASGIYSVVMILSSVLLVIIFRFGKKSPGLADSTA